MVYASIHKNYTGTIQVLYKCYTSTIMYYTCTILEYYIVYMYYYTSTNYYIQVSKYYTLYKYKINKSVLLLQVQNKILVWTRITTVQRG